MPNGSASLNAWHPTVPLGLVGAFPQAQSNLNVLIALLANAELLTDPSARLAASTSAWSNIDSLYSAIGTNINFTMGPGNLMF